MKNRFLINEQEDIKKKHLDAAIAAGCFNGKGYNTEKTNYSYGNYTGGLWRNAGNEWIWVFPTDNPKEFTVIYTEPIINGKITKGPHIWDRCEALNASIYANPKFLNPGQTRTLNYLTDKGFLLSDDQKGNVTEYDLLDINQSAGKEAALKIIQNQDILDNLTNKKVFYMWIPKEKAKEKGFVEKGQMTNTDEEAKKFVDYLLGMNWKQNVSPNETSKYVKCDLANTTAKDTNFGKNCYSYESMKNQSAWAQYFGNGYTLYMPIGTTGSNAVTEPIESGYSDQYVSACSTARNNNFEKKSCFDCILNYYNAVKNSEAYSAPEPGYADLVDMCLKRNQDNFPRLKKVIPKLRGDGLGSQKAKWAIKKATYKTKKNIFGTIKEDQILSKTINESLYKLKQNKQRLLTERTIVNNRLGVILENKNLRSKKNLNSFFNKFLNETAYLNHYGYNQKVINEGLMDMLGQFFSGTGMESVLQYFKEYAAKWVLSQFGINTNSWVATTIITTIGNLPLGDISKLTDCNYVVPLLSKSLAEAGLKKFTTSTKQADPGAKPDKFAGMKSGVIDIIRNAVVEAIDSTALAQSLEHKLSEFICPIWNNLVQKMGAVTNKLAANSENN